MKNIFIPLFVLITSLANSQPIKTVYIQPLGDVDIEVISTVKSSVETFYGYKCIVKPKSPLTEDILTDSKKRYEASRILQKFNSKQNLIILLLSNGSDGTSKGHPTARKKVRPAGFEAF